MCVLCAVHRVSQVVPSMLPWVVVPLLALWAASQLLPPPLRFEVTPPRLACGLFLVAVLLWHHVLMPQLLTWQARRSARMQERRRFLAVELQRLRRSAIRRCRNCLTEYRDQNPPAGRFMCCYCGHVSKRPVFDLPGGPGILHELLAGAGMCADGLGPPRRWLVGSIPEKPPSPWRLLSMLLGTIQWLRDKIPVGSGQDGLDADGKDTGKEGSRADCSESKCDKARRKAEEKRQARLEREMQEEEERKQREEVFRLIEEQRKLRDEKLEAVKEALRSSALDIGRDGRKDSTKKRNVRKKEKDCGSSKSNSDVEESIGKEFERRCELEKKLESERQQGCKKSFVVENSRKAHPLVETLQGFKGTANGNKSRYFDRFRGSFFMYNSSNNGKGAHNAVVPSSKPSKPIGWPVGDSHSSGQVSGKQSLNGDDKVPSVAANQHPAIVDQPQPNVWKNKTHRLFKNSLAITPIAPPNGQMSQNNDQQSPTNSSTKNSSNVAQTLPFSSHPYIDCPVGSDLASLVTQVASESLPSVDDTFHSSISEEGELFEDPCYVPDPVELLGPVSESLDNFPVDAGRGFASQTSSKGSGPVADDSIFNSIAASRAPSLNFPMSALDRTGANDNIASMDFHRTSVTEDSCVSKLEGNVASEPSIWRMWGSSLRPNPLGVIGGCSSWLSPIEEDESERKAVKHPTGEHTLLNHIEGRPLSGTNSPLINYSAEPKNGDTFAKLDACLTNSVPWMQKGVTQSNHAGKIIPPLKLQETADVSEVSHDSPSRSPSSPSYEISWSKEDWPALGCQGCEDGGKAVLPRPNIGGPFGSDSHAQSLWSFS